MYFVYILQSAKDNSFYIGYTSNIEERLWEHNEGRTRFAKYKRPWNLIYKEIYQVKTVALKREKYLKSLKNKRYLAKIIGLQGL